MPRNASGEYTLPAGNPVAVGTLISPTWANPTMDDIGTELTNSLDRNGRGGMLVPFKFLDGTTNAPGLTFATEPGLGFYRAGTNDLRAAVGGDDRTRWINDSGSPVGAQQPFEIWNGMAWVKAVTTDTELPYLPITGGDLTGPLTINGDLAFTSTGNANIVANRTTGYLNITSSSAGSLGANIRMFPETHGSNPNDFRIRTGISNKLAYSASTDTWSFSCVNLDRNGNTIWDEQTLALMPQAEAEAGTSTTKRTISAQRLNQAIQALAPGGGGGGAGIKSVQRGTTTVVSSAVVPIAAVDLDKSYVTQGAATGVYFDGAVNRTMVAAIRLTSSTTLTTVAPAGAVSSVDGSVVSWEVVEFE